MARRWLASASARARASVTPADLAVATGLPVAAATHALLSLASSYPCRIHVEHPGNAPDGVPAEAPAAGSTGLWPDREAGPVLAFSFTSLDAMRARGPLGAAWARVRRWIADARDPALATLSILLLPVLAVLAIGGCAALGVAIASQGTALRILGSPLTLISAAVGLAWAGVGLSVIGILAAAVLGLVLAFGAVFVPVGTVVSLILQPQPLPDTLIALGAAALVTALLAWSAHAFLGPAREMWRSMIRASGGTHWVVSLWRWIGGFLVGPFRDPRAREHALTRWIAARGGVLTEADLPALFGWSLARSDSALTRILLDHGGDVVVSDEGAILFVFPSLATSPSADACEPLWASERVETPRFFGVPRWFRTMVGVALGVPALASLALPVVGGRLLPSPRQWFRDPPAGDTSAAAALWERSDAVWGPVVQGIGVWPWLAIAGVLLSRLPAHGLRVRAYRRMVARLPLLRAAWASPAGAWLPAADVDATTLAALDGTIDEEAGTLGPDGTPQFRVRFRRFVDAAAARERWMAGDRTTIRSVLSIARD